MLGCFVQVPSLVKKLQFTSAFQNECSRDYGKLSEKGMQLAAVLMVLGSRLQLLSKYSRIKTKVFLSHLISKNLWIAAMINKILGQSFVSGCKIGHVVMSH